MLAARPMFENLLVYGRAGSPQPAELVNDRGCLGTSSPTVFSNGLSHCSLKDALT